MGSLDNYHHTLVPVVGDRRAGCTLYPGTDAEVDIPHIQDGTMARLAALVGEDGGRARLVVGLLRQREEQALIRMVVVLLPVAVEQGELVLELSRQARGQPRRAVAWILPLVLR